MPATWLPKVNIGSLCSSQIVRAVRRGLVGACRTAAIDYKVRILHNKARRWRQFWRLHFLYAKGAVAGFAVKVGVVVVMSMDVAVPGTKGIFQPLTSINGLMDQATFFKGFQGSIQGNSVGILKTGLQIPLR